MESFIAFKSSHVCVHVGINVDRQPELCLYVDLHYGLHLPFGWVEQASIVQKFLESESMRQTSPELGRDHQAVWC